MKRDGFLEKLKACEADLRARGDDRPDIDILDEIAPAAKGDAVNDAGGVGALQPRFGEARTQEPDVEEQQARETEAAAPRRAPPSNVVAEIYYSPFKMLSMSALGMIMTGTSVFIAAQDSFLSRAVGYIGATFFGIVTGSSIWRLLTARGPVVTITSQGIRDTRVAEELIPWGSVLAVESVEMERQKFTVLTVEPAVESKLTLTRMARWSLGPNRLLGVDGLPIPAQGLKISHDKLFIMIKTYWELAQ